MPVKQQYILTNTPGEDIYLFTLSNAKGTEALITNYGAIITSFKLKNNDGTVNDIVLGFDKAEDYWSPEYLQQYTWFGSAVGRYANRIKNAEINIDGKKYLLSKNKGNDQLHGGLHGFDKKVWKLISSGEALHSFVEFRYLSKEEEEGFPGNLEVLVRFELNDENELSYQYTATCDKPTAINLTHHSYFNLNNGVGSIHDHEIKIYASHMLEQDDNLVTTGNIVSVADTVFDFRNYQRIGDCLAKIPEYDKSYVANQESDMTGLKLMAEARSSLTKTHLQVYSTEPVVHFYTGKWIPGLKGKNNITYGSFSGFCLETHKHPNAINIPQFPNTVLRPGEIYKEKTVYKIV
jgi:aldose 1-epimerase